MIARTVTDEGPNLVLASSQIQKDDSCPVKHLIQGCIVPMGSSKLSLVQISQYRGELPEKKKTKHGNCKERETSGPDFQFACEMRGMPAENELRICQRRQL